MEVASLRAAAAAEREAGHAAGAAACAAARAAEEAALAEREASCSAVAPFADERQQCDEPGREEVNEFTCVKKGCCWRPGPTYWCFHPPPRVGPRGAVAVAARARPAKMAPRGEGAPPVFAVMAMMKDEHFSLREWLEHYTWQGADVVLLLDNNSTVSAAHVARDFPIVTVLPAPLRHLQHQYYGSLGREWLEARGVDYVLVVDVDEYFFSDAPGRTLKDLVVEALQGAPAQLTCAFHHFGSSGFEKQPAGVRECFTRAARFDPAFEAANWQFGKSAIRLRDASLFSIHHHVVHGPSVGCPPNMRYNHYRVQSREFWERVKMARGAADHPHMDSYRTLKKFHTDDAWGNDTDDFVLRDLLRSAGLAKGAC